jgi:hypothetical protein
MVANEALWAQIAGVTYSAAEDRKVIAALSAPGVVQGLEITPTTGRGVSVSIGSAVVDDKAGGCYVAYTTSAVPLTITAGLTESIFLVIDEDTALATVISGTTPPATDPYLVLGSVKAGATALDTAYGTAGVSMVNRLRAYPPAMNGVNGQSLYLPLAGGGVVAGPVQATRLLVPGLLGVGGADLVPNAPKGVRLGGTNPTARHYHHIASLTTPTSSINRFASSSDMSARESVYWKSSSVGVSDYDRKPYNPDVAFALYAGVDGYYEISGAVNTEGPNTGRRRIYLSVFDGSTLAYEFIAGASTNDDVVTFAGLVPMKKDQNVRVRVAHTVGSSINAQGGSRVMFRLVQAN